MIFLCPKFWRNHSIFCNFVGKYILFMPTCRIHIVALPYYEAGKCLSGFMAQALGRSMTLRPEQTNEVDVNAVRAYDWQGRHVGYASALDQSEVKQALRGSGRHSLRGRVVEVNEEHKYLMFECSVETVGEVEDLYPDARYLDWMYSGPTLKPTPEMVTLEYMTDEIFERLCEYEEWNDDEKNDFLQLGARFCKLSRYDLSGNMFDYRRRLCLRLMDINDETLMPLVEELKMAFGRTGRDLHGGEVLEYWIRVLSEPKMVCPLFANRKEFDVKVIRGQLKKFPCSMYDEWKENRKRFVTKLLYMHVPRQVLWAFVSGIAYCEAIDARKQAKSKVKNEGGGKSVKRVPGGKSFEKPIGQLIEHVDKIEYTNIIGNKNGEEE